MRERTESIQIRILMVCAGLLIGMTGVAAVGIKLPGAEMFGLTTTLVVLGMLYLVCYRSTRQQILSLKSELEERQKRENLGLEVVESLAQAIDARDQRGQGRAERVQDLAVMIAEELGIPEERMEELRIAAMLADVGKLAVPDHILSKPGPLTEEELRKVRTHAAVGANILAGVHFSGAVVPIVRGHHEWFDGSGYPDGLKGEEIPLGARILAVADVYDALLCDRPHRRAFPATEAAEILDKAAGTQFDPEIVAAFFRGLHREKERERFGFIFDAEDLPSAPLLADLSNHQRAAFADIAQAQRELLALFEIVQTVSASLNMQETLDLLMSKTRKILNFATGVIFFPEPEGEHLRAIRTCGLLASQLQDRVLRWGEGISGQVAKSGLPSALNADARQDLSLLLEAAAAEAGSLAHALAVPLFHDGRAVCGTLTLYQTAESPFSEDDLRLLTTVAAQASIAISKAGAYEQTERTALTDVLTGLPNARHFFLRLEGEIARASREGRPLSLLLLDIDEFKKVNDNFGHQQGDQVLRELAAVFSSAVREYDFVARYGGDEFFMLMPGTPNKQALETALRIKEAVGRYQPGFLEKSDASALSAPGQDLRLRVSIGVATYPGDATEAKALLAIADKAMYADKELHRRQWQLLKTLTGKGKEVEEEPSAAPPRPSSAILKPFGRKS